MVRRTPVRQCVGMAWKDDPLLWKGLHAAPQVLQGRPERGRVASVEIGTTATSQEQAIARHDDAVTQEGQVTWCMTRRSDGLEGEFAHMEGRGDVWRGVEGTCVWAAPTPFPLRLMDDHFETLTAERKGLLDSFCVVPMAVGQPSPNQPKTMCCCGLKPEGCVEGVNHDRFLAGRAHDQVIQVVPFTKLSLQDPAGRR